MKIEVKGQDELDWNLLQKAYEDGYQMGKLIAERMFENEKKAKKGI